MAGFLEHFNGKSFFVDETCLTGDYLQLFTDGAGAKDVELCVGPNVFGGIWPLSWLSLNIIVLELYPIMTTVEIWGKPG